MRELSSAASKNSAPHLGERRPRSTRSGPAPGLIRIEHRAAHESAAPGFRLVAQRLQIGSFRARPRRFQEQLPITFDVAPRRFESRLQRAGVIEVIQQDIEDRVGIFLPPAAPSASTGVPFLATIVGHILWRGRFPAATEFGWPGRGSKRDIP